MRRMRLWLLTVMAIAACGDNAGAVRPLSNWDGEFFEAPFPRSTRQRADGTIALLDFPNPRQSPLADGYIAAADAHNVGFGRNTAVWFPLDGSIDADSLPESPVLSPSLSDSVYLVNVDTGSATYGETVPIEVVFKRDPETYSPANLLVLVPYQGFVLSADTYYAAVVTSAVVDERGGPLRRTADLDAALAGDGPMGPDMQRLVELFDQRGRSTASIAGATVYRTGDPSQAARAMARAIDMMTPPELLNLRVIDDFPLFSVLEGELDIPLFQTGTKPYDTGGVIELDAGGVPIAVATETVRVSLSIPKSVPPDDGFPLLIYLAGQGGSYRQVVDRGPIDNDGDGDGPARFLANRGVASLGLEANLTGPRHPGGDVTGIQFFNIENIVALRDNHRQAVAEAGLIAQAAALFEIPAALVPQTDAGGNNIEFDTDKIYVYGHSTGSIVAAVALGVFPEFSRGVLSGSGGSWLYNLTIKQTPAVAAIVSGLLGLRVGDQPDIFDPMLNIVATLWEPIEPMNHAADWEVDVLLIAGIVDTYFLPRMIGALSIAADLFATAPSIDDTIETDLALIGHSTVDLPAIGGFVLQYPAVQGSDGHFVPFELDQVKHQRSCFIATSILPVANDDPLAPCL